MNDSIQCEVRKCKNPATKQFFIYNYCNKHYYKLIEMFKCIELPESKIFQLYDFLIKKLDNLVGHIEYILDKRKIRKIHYHEIKKTD